MGNKGTVCNCAEAEKGNVSKRHWRIVQYKCNYSAFNGYKYTPSDYSTVICARCHANWRTKSAYIHREVPQITSQERAAWHSGMLLQFLEQGTPEGLIMPEGFSEASPKNWQSPGSFVAVRKGKKPCGECPYLRNSLPGYFGANEPEVYAEPITNDALLPCHKVQHTEKQHICVGLLLTRINTCKRGQHPVLVRDEETVRQLPTEVRATCFSNRFEFEAYHAQIPGEEKEFFITFGSKHTHIINGTEFNYFGYCTITAQNENEAREMAMYLFSDQWAFSYNNRAQLAALPAGEQGKFSAATLKESMQTDESGAAGHGPI